MENPSSSFCSSQPSLLKPVKAETGCLRTAEECGKQEKDDKECVFQQLYPLLQFNFQWIHGKIFSERLTEVTLAGIYRLDNYLNTVIASG